MKEETSFLPVCRGIYIKDYVLRFASKDPRHRLRLGFWNDEF